nr:uncharacterized protein LOC109153954 [Ipomoea batatas]
MFGAWASQAAADYNLRPERPIKPPRKQFGNDNSEVKTKTETPEVNSSPAPPTKTTPPAPDQSSTPVLESVDRIANRAEMSDSIVQTHSGLIFQWPGNNRKLEFKTEKTNGKAMFIHTMIFIVIYVIIIALSHGKI